MLDVLGRGRNDAEMLAARAAIPDGARARQLLDGQRDDGGFGAHPYYGWFKGTHWRLLALANIAYPGPDPRIGAALDNEFATVVPFFADTVAPIDGRVRRHGCVEGNLLSAACRLGYAGDPRIGHLAQTLMDGQWPDGGWNSDLRRQARVSSFWESHEPLAGLTDYHAATGDARALESVRAAAEFFLRRRLFRSQTTGLPIEPKWLVAGPKDIADPGAKEWTLLHYPTYWYYDILRGLDVLRPLGLLTDARAQEALDLLEAACNEDGTWSHTGTPYWGLEGEPDTADSIDIRDRDGIPVEAVDWGRHGPNEMITLIALRILRAAGRL